MAESSSKCVVKIHLLEGVPTIWNADDVIFIQTHCRIIGFLNGPLPRMPLQIKQFGLPLILMKEEAQLLVEKGYATLVIFSDKLLNPNEQIKNDLNSLRKKSFKEQRVAAVEARKAEIVKLADSILDGKIKKLSDKPYSDPITLTKEDVIREECKKITPLAEKFENIQTFIEHPFIDKLDTTTINWSYPYTAYDKLKYSIFKDLWEKDYFLTSGEKFGGDYLVYPNDPSVCHALYIIQCFKDDEKIDPHDIVLWSRVATTTKKKFYLASKDNNNCIHYRSFYWTGDFKRQN